MDDDVVHAKLAIMTVARVDRESAKTPPADPKRAGHSQFRSFTSLSFFALSAKSQTGLAPKAAGFPDAVEISHSAVTLLLMS